MTENGSQIGSAASSGRNHLAIEWIEQPIAIWIAQASHEMARKADAINRQINVVRH